MLLAYGYQGTRDRLFQELKAMGAKVTDHSINRVDFAMDFRTRNFELRANSVVAHAHTKIRPHWSEKSHTIDQDQPSTILRGRRLESITVGKMPGRQIIIYDKRREAIERQKHYWFEAWGIAKDDPDLEVWRIEIRAGKKELKDKYQMRTFDDFEAGIGDVIVKALHDVRYLDDRQTDGNVSRQTLHPLWTKCQDVAAGKLTNYRSGLTPWQIREIEREAAQEQYRQLILGNAIGLGVSLGLSDEEILAHLPGMLAAETIASIQVDATRPSKAIERARARLHFIVE